jgi:hypothetical protein
VRRERVSSRYALAWITVASFVAFAINIPFSVVVAFAINVSFSATAVILSLIVAFAVFVESWQSIAVVITNSFSNGDPSASVAATSTFNIHQSPTASGAITFRIGNEGVLCCVCA